MYRGRRNFSYAYRNKGRRTVKKGMPWLYFSLFVLGIIAGIVILCSIAPKDRSATLPFFCIWFALAGLGALFNLYCILTARKGGAKKSTTCPCCGKEVRYGFEVCGYCNNRIHD